MGDQLFSGALLTTAGPPRSQKTWLAKRLKEMLGECAIIASGKAFTEPDQHSLRSELLTTLRSTREQHGLVVLLFDDIHLALARSGGGLLEQALVAELIDGPMATDTAALFLTRCSGPHKSRTTGSPLLTRTTKHPLPTVPARLQGSHRDLTAAFGDSLALWHEYARARQPRIADVVARVSQEADLIADDVTQAARAANRTGRFPDSLAWNDLASLSGLSWEGAPTRLSTESGLDELLRRDSAGWPSAIGDAARRFAGLIDSSSTVVWCDRYLLPHTDRLVEFLHAVRQHSKTGVNVLTMKEPPGHVYSASDARRLLAVPGVRLRFMHRGSVASLHDRHLASLDGGGGFVLPEGRVVLALAAAGSAVVAPTSGFPIDYARMWAESIDPT
ncbi:hypothetical protein NWP09_00260 [Agrococcus sp. HG114]|nr:hypothetical protein [Agrococcus sp. HG114]